jgi:hypothetical protein
MADSAALLVDEILPHQPMRQWVLSVPFPIRFLFASRPDVMGKVLGIVYRAIATHLSHKAGYTKASSQTGAVTLIQCFGGALNLNVHYHMLFPDGVYIEAKNRTLQFHRVKAPTIDELSRLTHTIAHRVGGYLERRGLLERDTGQPYLTSEALGPDDETPIHQLLGSAVTCRIAVGPQQGRRVMTLQTLPDDGDEPFTTRVGNVAGFSLHAGVATRTHERDTKSRRPQASWNACAAISPGRRLAQSVCP